MTDYKSLDEIIKFEIKNQLPSQKHTYKLSFRGESEDSASVQNDVDFQNSFLTIKVKKQIYLGQEAIALHIESASKKIYSKIDYISDQEKI